MIINSKVDFHGWKSTSNHWLPNKGRIPNTCVSGFGEQAMSLEVHDMER